MPAALLIIVFLSAPFIFVCLSFLYKPIGSIVRSIFKYADTVLKEEDQEETNKGSG